MTKIFFLSIALLSAAACFSQSALVDTTVYLQIGESQIACLKRYVVGYSDPDTGEKIVYSPPRLYTYLFKDYEFHYIKTCEHVVYGFTEDPATGNRTCGGKFTTDSISVAKCFGVIDKNQLFDDLIQPMFLKDTKEDFNINLDFIVELSSEDEYVIIMRTQRDFHSILAYEIEQLNPGDLVVIRDLNFNSNVSPFGSTLYAGYWIIR